MHAFEHDFYPGSLVRARGREWMVLPGSELTALRLRPLSGAEDESVVLIPALELQPVEAARFAWPEPGDCGNHAGALLLRDALRLSLRAGAGPFRSFGHIAVEPRGYQLVPLLMALRLPVVRLLIADDVGIGKTIEAGLIVRELMDRGEIARVAILCPPHLVEQWQSELQQHFHLASVALTAAAAPRIERELPHGVGLFDHHPVVVVSLDYIKSERHREQFIQHAPECILVDEAHTCTGAGAGKQLRFALLRRLAEDPQRHLLLLTATPHSGDETAFHNLLSLLHPKFAALQGRIPDASDPMRRELARHFVQRRRQDIAAWQAEVADGRSLPRRMQGELSYRLTGAWGRFFDAVQDYCRALAESVAQQNQAEGAARLIWYATLALLRCVASSPAAAVKALTTRLQGEDAGADDSLLPDERIDDGDASDLTGHDLEPPAQLDADAQGAHLTALIAQAEKLCGAAGDPKLATLIAHIRLLLQDGFAPVVFCRYIATAHYVAAQLQSAFPAARVEAVSGELTAQERRARVEDLGAAASRILVATDCLSEGVNLQHHFNAVVHYDLAWNPTRHEQREGRVDRYGQASAEVRCTLLYGQDNPVDGFILKVILRKGAAIREELGVLVPLPEDAARVREALVQAALMRRNTRQAELDFDAQEQALAPLATQWQDALAKARRNRTVFAQRSLKPDEVLPEWRKQQQALGNPIEVQQFVRHSCARLGSPLSQVDESHADFLPRHLPETLRQRLADAGIDSSAPLRLDWQTLARSHPLVGVLAQHLLEDALDGARAPQAPLAGASSHRAPLTGASSHRAPLAARCAVTLTREVEVATTLYLLRLRHHLTTVRRGASFPTMAEETVTLAVRGRANPQWFSDFGDTSDDGGDTHNAATRLLDCTPSGDLPRATVEREIRAALDVLSAHPEVLHTLADARAQALLADHQRVRAAALDTGQTRVHACLPVDVMGVYVLLPDAL